VANLYMRMVEELRREIDDMKWLAESEGRKPFATELSRMASINQEIEHLEACFALGGDKAPEIRSLNPPLRPELGDTGGYRPGSPPQNRTFRGMFPDVSLNNGGFKSQDEFLEILSSGRHDPRLIRATHTEGLPSEGGFSVPVEYAAQWLDLSLVSEIVRPLASIWPMQSSSRKVPGWDLLDMTGGTCFGGFEMQFLGEGGTGSYQTGKLRQIEMNAKKGAIYTQMSNELLADGVNFSAQLQSALIGSVTYGLDKAFLQGTGASMPLGVLKASSLITVTKESGQIADTIVYENLANMWARMYPAGRKRAYWVANDDTIPQLLQCSIQLSGLAGQFYPVMNETSGQYFIFGRPVLFSPVMPSLGDAGDIALVDFTQYAIGLRKDMSIDRSQHVGFQQDLDTWRIIIRFDGMPTWNSVFTPESGATMSWAVALGAR
jgi:HK97 family phage major capsid protein